MRYLLLVCDDPDAVERLDDGERHGILPAYRDLTSALRAAGQLVAADALEPVTTATTVRLRAGKRLVSDGPFADTREHVVGYYVIDAADLDQALAESFGLERPDGALVSSVEPDSAAAKAGIKPGDVITKVDGSLVDSPNKLSRLVAGVPPGSTVDVEVVRDGRRMLLNVALSERRDNVVVASLPQS